MEEGKEREIEVRFCLDEELRFHDGGAGGGKGVHNEGCLNI